MQIRASRISDSITNALSQDDNHNKTLLTRLTSFFAFFKLSLTRYRPADFTALRLTWSIPEDTYVSSFTESELIPAGDLGYSGSTFFTTPDGNFLVKSLPRRFEHQFFTHVLLSPYINFQASQPESFLVRITDMPYASQASLGGILGTAPTHHIVMENLLQGKEDDWETFDLKPADYFFPERDVLDGNLAPQSVKDKLADKVPHKITISLDNKECMVTQLNHDTQLLKSHAAVDYSLFLVRYPTSQNPFSDTPADTEAQRGNWRKGVPDVLGKWTYRAVVLDFFWAKSALQAKAMTGLVDTYNLVAGQGPMSITAEPGEYRERFMRMVNAIFVASAVEEVESEEVEGEGVESDSSEISCRAGHPYD